MAQHKGFEIICLRYFNPIGAHHTWLLWENPKWIPTNLVPFLLKVAKKEIEKITIFWDDYPTPDGTCIRDYIHIEDLADAHLQSYEYLLKKAELNNNIEETIAPSFEIFNIWTW
jgi:UDP-glucose 4-epimerase